MRYSTWIGLALGAAIVALVALPNWRLHAQPADANSAPNPYRMEENWAKLPEGRKLGAVIAVEIDRDGKSIWLFERCGANSCRNSNLAPIMKFDSTGKYVTSFGAGMFNFPHGLGLDRDGNVWVTDEQTKNGKGAVAVKFNPEGKVLMTLGKAGMPGDGPDMLDGPSDVVVAPNGDIYVADGHGGTTNDRIVKFSKEGKFIKAWGKHGKAEGEFDTPHGIAMDSSGRIYVADRVNSRIQVFDADGKQVAVWKQFGRPTGVSVDKNDIIYVTDAQSTEKTNPGFQKGIRSGSVKDGKVTAFIPETATGIGPAEAVAADDQGVLYAGFAPKMSLRRFVKK